MNAPLSCFESPRHNAKKVMPVLGAATALFLCCVSLFSQGSQGTIQGAVFDQTGGVVAGASVSVIDVARGFTRALVTDDAGEYVATNLNPGNYTIRAEARGFRTVEHSGVLVEVGQNIRVDLIVQPGEQTQTITVSGEVPAIDTTDATLGGTVSNDAINALPLNGRNFYRLLQLRPGVITPIGSGTGSSVTNGRRSGDDLLLVEGMAQIGQSLNTSLLNSVYRGGDSGSLLPIDAIQEFNTEQNPKAEYGWRDGSVITIGIKSGTNSLHGTAYAFGRDASATDAANYFSSPGVPGVTPATLEQFGASAGGRIIKDKLFWFASYEGLRVTLGDVAVDTIPSDVSVGNPTKSMVDACNAVKNSGKTISPLSAQLAGLNTSTCVVSPASPSFENLFPYNPNASNNFAPGLVSGAPLNNGIFKGDYIPSPHHHLSGTYYVSKADQQLMYAAGQLLPQWISTVVLDTQMYGGSWTWTPNSTWVNDVRLGYSYIDDKSVSNDVNMLPSNPWPNGYGFPTGVTNPLYGGLPQITFSGFTGYLGAGNHTSVRGPEGNVTFTESVSYLRGKHAFKFGFNYLDIVFDGNSYIFANGMIKFSSLQNFLLGAPSGGTILIGDPTLSARSHWFAPFFQDDWRITPRVTLNLGLRYEYQTPPTERNNYLGNFNPNVNPATTPAVQQVGPGAPIPSLYNPGHRDFSPRLGVAWDVRGNGKTVIRAAVGILRDASILGTLVGVNPFGANFPSIGVNNSGTAINIHTPDQVNPAGCGAPVCPGSFTWSQAGPVFPISAAQVINGVTYTGVTCTVATPCAASATDPNFRQPYAAEWNLDIQRAITSNLTVDVAYVGNHGFREVLGADLNQPALGAGWAGSAATNCINSAPFYNNCKVNTAAEIGPYSGTFPYLNYMTQVQNGGFSNYDGLQVTVNERLSHGLSFLAGYTYSHALDELSSNSSSAGVLPSDGSNERLSYGNSNNDVRHRFTFSPTYRIPGIKSPGQMLEGWSVSSLVLLQGGLPWFPSDSATDDLLGTGEYNNGDFTSGVTQPWNYAGPRSAFTSSATPIPCFGTMAGCSPYPTATVNGIPNVPQLPAACVTAATAPYDGNSQLQSLAVASLTNFGCYIQNGGVLTPPAYGTIGNANRNLFRGASYTWIFRFRRSGIGRSDIAPSSGLSFSISSTARTSQPLVPIRPRASAEVSVTQQARQTQATPCLDRVVRGMYSSA